MSDLERFKDRKSKWHGLCTDSHHLRHPGGGCCPRRRVKHGTTGHLRLTLVKGLPLAVTLALAFATKRMTKENLLVRVLGSCETMANASVICTDKTGTLTQNTMAVVAGSIGIHAKFARQLQHNQSKVNVVDEHHSRGSTDTGVSGHNQDFSVDKSQINTVLSPQLRKLFNAAIAINTTAFEDADPVTDQMVFIGSKTEVALLNFAKELRWPSYRETRDAAEVVQMLPFSSERKAMGVVVRLEDGNHRLYLKGASELLTKLCIRHVVVSPNANQASDEDATVETAEIDTYAEVNVSRTIIFYANQSLRTMAICYRDFTTWPPPGLHRNMDDDVCPSISLILSSNHYLDTLRRPRPRTHSYRHCRHRGSPTRGCSPGCCRLPESRCRSQNVHR